MNSFRKYSLFLFSVLCFSLVIPVVGTCSQEEVVATVGTVPVTRNDLDREVRKTLPMEVSFHGGISGEKVREVREKALEKVIERACMVQYAAREGIRVESAELDPLYGAIRGRFKTEEDFRKGIGKETPEGLRAALQRELLAAKALNREVEEKIRLTDEEMRASYEEHRLMYAQPKRFRASLIEIHVDPAALEEKKDELKKRAETLAEKAKAGEDFYNLAYHNSDDRSRYVGGDIGYVHFGRLLPELEKAVMELKVGEIEGPIRTDYGYTILQLTEMEDARQLSFEEVKEKIRRKMEEERRTALLAAWMQDLKSRYEIRRLDVAQEPSLAPSQEKSR